MWGKNGFMGLTLKIRSEMNTGLGDVLMRYYQSVNMTMKLVRIIEFSPLYGVKQSGTLTIKSMFQQSLN